MDELKGIKTKYTQKENTEKNGIELYFEGIPTLPERKILKENGFRFHGVKKCWYKRINHTTQETEQLKDEINKLKDEIDERESKISELKYEIEELQDETTKTEIIENLVEYIDDNHLLNDELKNLIEFYMKFYV